MNVKDSAKQKAITTTKNINESENPFISDFGLYYTVGHSEIAVSIQNAKWIDFYPIEPGLVLLKPLNLNECEKDN